jgi:hypothetical protein
MGVHLMATPKEAETIAEAYAEAVQTARAPGVDVADDLEWWFYGGACFVIALLHDAAANMDGDSPADVVARFGAELDAWLTARGV